MIRPEPAAVWALKPFGGLGALLVGNAVNGGAVAYVREPATVIFKKGDPVGKPAVPAKASSMVTAALILCNVLLIATKPTDAPRRWIIQHLSPVIRGRLQIRQCLSQVVRGRPQIVRGRTRIIRHCLSIHRP